MRSAGETVCMGRILGLDVGERRIGVAISDPEGRLAVPLRILERRSDDADAQAIAHLARAEGAGALVVGYPLSLDGSIGPQARRVQAFARRLAEASGLPLELRDERLTSVQAERAPTRPRGRAPKGARRRRAPADDLAAAIMLQSYLDRHRPDSPPPSGP
jgi:putative Holliday junction resolvase